MRREAKGIKKFSSKTNIVMASQILQKHRRSDRLPLLKLELFSFMLTNRCQKIVQNAFLKNVLQAQLTVEISNGYFSTPVISRAIERTS